jgi:hypothetical protein
MPGVGSAMSYVVSQTPNTLESASAPGPLHLEEVRSLSAPGKTASVPPPRKVLIRNATHKLALALAKCTETGTLLSTEEVLTLMDSEDPQEDGKYMDSLGDLVDFGVHNAIDIFGLEECFLATFGTIGRGGARNLRRFTQNKILVPLGLHFEHSPEPSIQVIEKPDQFRTIHKWRHEVRQASEGIKEEDIEDVEDTVKVVEKDEIEEAHGGTTLDKDEVEEGEEEDEYDHCYGVVSSEV